MTGDILKNHPITPLDYLSGVKVVDIGDIRVARGMSRRPASSCEHKQLHYDKQERRIWCANCEQNVDPFDAFELIASHFYNETQKLNRRSKE
jgi:hypothetical protein